jgi:hypothetical protein
MAIPADEPSGHPESGGSAVWRGKTLRIGITVAALGLALVVVVLVNSVCSCLPTVYEEVDLAAVPAQVLEKARGSAPGLIFHRAWKFAPGGRFDEGISGYLLRSGVHWYNSRDIRVTQWNVDLAPEHLEPIERNARTRGVGSPGLSEGTK